MNIPNIRVKRLDPDAQLPEAGNKYAAGLDLRTIESVDIPPGTRATLKTGLAIELPDAMVGLIWPRSKLAAQKGIDVLAGVVDCDYRGELMISLLNTSADTVELRKGDKVAQMIIQQYFSWLPIEVVDELNVTQRGDKGINCSDMRLN